MWRYWPKLLFFVLVVRPVVLLVMGLVVSNRERLPKTGPCIIAANHNSHLDTMVLMSLFPLRDLPRVRPVAAADYFLANRLMAWFSLNLIGIVPITRDASTDRDKLFGGCHEALARGDILILFPEGTRGDPEKMGALKKGIHHLVATAPSRPTVVPVYLYGLGKALPRGEALLVPFNIQVAIGEAMTLQGDATTSVAELEQRLHALAAQCRVRYEGA